jgi:hypothetical protein
MLYLLDPCAPMGRLEGVPQMSTNVDTVVTGVLDCGPLHFAQYNLCYLTLPPASENKSDSISGSLDKRLGLRRVFADRIVKHHAHVFRKVI